MKIKQDEWREAVFLPNLANTWDDMDDLHAQIVDGLNRGLAADLLPAAARLVEIDSQPERSHALYSAVLLENGQLDAAEATLRDGIDQVGETSTLLIGLAKVYSARSDEPRAHDILWQAVQQNPNADHGLQWWITIQREQRGENGYLEALYSAAALPHSWRPQLWLARYDLEHGKVDAARALYLKILTVGRLDGPSLTMIAGDLVQHGHLELLLDLVGPVYDENHHELATGLHLLNACLGLQRLDAGDALIARLSAVVSAPDKKRLDRIALALQELRKQGCQESPAPANLVNG